MNIKYPLIVVSGLVFAASFSCAADVSIDPAYIAADSGFSTSWNAAIWGASALVPSAGNNYYMDSGEPVNILGAHGAFEGDSITVTSGSAVFNRGGGDLGTTLNLAGGSFQNRTSGTVEITAGEIHVASTSVLSLISGSLSLSNVLSSTSDAVLRVRGEANVSDKAVFFNATDAGFLGAFQIEDTAGQDIQYTIRFDQSYVNATLILLGNSENSARAAVYQLENNISFAAVSMPNESGGLVDLAVGTYDATALRGAGVSSVYFNDLGGSIMVIPESSSLPLLTAGCALLTVIVRRHRKIC